MKTSKGNKLAAVLRVLVYVTMACNVLALVGLPAVLKLDQPTGEAPLLFTAWTQGWRALLAMEGDRCAVVWFLLFCGLCTLVILWQGKRVLDTVVRGEPFCVDNAKSLARAAVCCFAIALVACVRTVWAVVYYASAIPLATYNTLFVPIFAMAGLLCLVISALFRQAAQLKADNDLTI